MVHRYTMLYQAAVAGYGPAFNGSNDLGSSTTSQESGRVPRDFARTVSVDLDVGGAPHLPCNISPHFIVGPKLIVIAEPSLPYLTLRLVPALPSNRDHTSRRTHILAAPPNTIHVNNWTALHPSFHNVLFHNTDNLNT